MSMCVRSIFSLCYSSNCTYTYVRTYMHMGEHCTVHVCLYVLGILYVHLTEHIRSQKIVAHID